ncbi:MAG TPA: alkaline phosphatase family protein, partial [Gammaproteobacteria bacterium]|nr:alkaline phosphatase family protein [Gammaproteobacteria bacterium]
MGSDRNDDREDRGTGDGGGIDRRRRLFLGGMAAAAGSLALSACKGHGGAGPGNGAGGPPASDTHRSPVGHGGPSSASHASLPDPTRSGIEHVVVVMMENRSFDHYLGWLPGADGRQAGLSYQDKQGQWHASYPLAPMYQNCSKGDPDHSYKGGRIQYDDGRCDGWLKAGTDDLFPIGYYEQKDLSFLGQAVPDWTTFDRYFCGILGPTYPNRFFMHAAQTDRLSNTTTISTLPTIWDRCAAAGLTHAYYFSDIPFTALWGDKYLSVSRPYAAFLADAAAGMLPQLSFLDPRFGGEGQGISNDDHPFADIRDGEAFLGEVYRAVTASPNWDSTVLVITYDEWGGFFDHIAPPKGPVSPVEQTLGYDGLLGFRVPTMVISPFARRGHVEHADYYDHTSVLKMIEWRWNLPALSVRDAHARNL